jgi:hypothetical protein
MARGVKSQPCAATAAQIPCVALAVRGSVYCLVHRDHEELRERFPLELEPDEEFVGYVVTCAVCKGRGARCRSCHGTGTQYCFDCRDSHECGCCNGEGHVDCDSCHGAVGDMYRKRPEAA